MLLFLKLLQGLLTGGFSKWRQSLKPPVVRWLVLLDSGNHFLVLGDRLVVLIQLLPRNAAGVTVETLGELVVLSLDAFVLATTHTYIQRLSSIFADACRESAVTDQISCRLTVLA